MGPPKIGRFVALFHHRWAVPVLAELHRGAGGAKFVTLVNRLGIGRDSLRRTLAALIERGWVMPNPGHGHHWYGNAESYFLIGQALGEGMTNLLHSLP